MIISQVLYAACNNIATYIVRILSVTCSNAAQDTRADLSTRRAVYSNRLVIPASPLCSRYSSLTPQAYSIAAFGLLSRNLSLPSLHYILELSLPIAYWSTRPGDGDTACGLSSSLSALRLSSFQCLFSNAAPRRMDIRTRALGHHHPLVRPFSNGCTALYGRTWIS